jgi:hypothetical protein
LRRQRIGAVARGQLVSTAAIEESNGSRSIDAFARRRDRLGVIVAMIVLRFR